MELDNSLPMDVKSFKYFGPDHISHRTSRMFNIRQEGEFLLELRSLGTSAISYGLAVRMMSTSGNRGHGRNSERWLDLSSSPIRY